MKDSLQDVAVAIPCSRCHAAAGDWCTTKSGWTAIQLHSARINPAQHAYWLGYEQGEKDTLLIIADKAARAGVAL